MASDTDSSSSGEISDSDDLPFWKIRGLEFRVLIIGRVNAGKTTILERLTGASIDNARITTVDGKLLDGKAIKGQSDRSLHNIDDEIRFPSRPGFVFHDSRGFEAGSSEELSTVRKFVEDRSSAVSDLRLQLHAIWMCLPLDDSRELFDTEKEPFRWFKGDTPLVVIFTKRDGAIAKVTSQIIQDNSSPSESTISRAFKKQARAKAEVEVTECVKKREEELKQLSKANSAVAFLTTSDMAEPTEESAAACANLIKATQEGLKGPRIKTLLSIVWGC
ncbi:hypothetical protein BJV78DRAFT_1214335, partial [Lactifluus subvellereus]